MGQPDVSVILCTYNPRADYLDRVLVGLRRQTLSFQHWELLLIDNASKESVAERFDIGWHPNGRHVREDELGLTPARLLPAGIVGRLISAGQPESASLPARPAPPKRPIDLPDTDRFRWLAAKTRVRIDKAKRVLGYQPQYDLARGMHRTRLWAEWADLLGTR